MMLLLPFMSSGLQTLMEQKATPEKQTALEKNPNVGPVADLIASLLDDSRKMLRYGNIDSAMMLVFDAREKAMELPEPSGLTYAAACNQLIGEICYTRFIEEEALNFYFLALHQYWQGGSLKGVAESLNSIALTALGMQKEDVSRQAIHALNFLIKYSSDPHILALHAEALGDYFDAVGSSDSAIFYFEAAMHYFQLANEPEKVSDVLLSRAICEFYSGDHAKALLLTDSAKQFNLQNDLRRNYLEAVYYEAEFLGVENPEQGIAAIRKTLPELYKHKLNIHLGIYLRLLIRLQKQTGDFEAALQSTEEFHRVLNEIYGSDAERKIASLQLEVETEKLNSRIDLLQKEQELSSANARSQRNMLFYFFLAIMVLFMMALNNMRRLQYRLYLLKEFTLDFPLARILIAFVFGLLYYLVILYFVNPLNLSGRFADFSWLHYAVTGFLISALTSAGITLLPAHWSARPGFNKRFTIIAILFLLIINMVVIGYAWLSVGGFGSWVEYLNVMLVITGVTIIPVFFFIIYLEKVLLRKHIQLAGLLSNRIQSAPASDDTGYIEIFSDRSKDVVRIASSDLILIEAAGNYAKICHVENNRVKSTLILATMKLIETQLAAHEQFSRCHKSYIVNLSKVKKVLGNSHGYKLDVSGAEQQVPVSRSYAETFIKSFDKVYRK